MKKMTALLLALVLMIGMTACGGEKTPSEPVDLQALYASMEDGLPQMLVLDKDLMMNFLGIEADGYTQVLAAICMEGLRADEIWMVEAADEASLLVAKKLAESRLEAKAEETVNYNPEQYAVVEKAQLLTYGNYLILLVSPDVDALKAQVEAAFN